MSRRSQVARRGGGCGVLASGRAVACAAVLLGGLGSVAVEARGQGVTDRAAYLRVVTEHYELPAGEAERLLENGIALDELPLVLFLDRESGIAAPAILAMRRSGAPWMTISARAGVRGDRLHVEIPAEAVDARTRRIHDFYTRTPRSLWQGADFSDEEVVTLVNVKMLSRFFSVPVERVLRVRGGVDSWIAVPAVLVRGGRG
jgi:hypothetical protein